jgi:2,4-dienoyl-CoA reductase-like NADH-dependent reductase (Old Yellow Enzyme family)/thioredoxin reductase
MPIRKYEQLLKPLTINSMEVSNRVVMPPITTVLANWDGSVSEAMLAYMGRVSSSGAALFITEATAIHPDGMETPGMLGIYHDRFINGLNRLARTIQANGAKAMIQIYHVGRESRFQLERGRAVAPSALPGIYGIKPRELQLEEIQQLIKGFGEAAVRARKAGFDGVELHGAHGYLLMQFLSGLSNQREDEYGGNFRQRARFILEVIKEVRRRVGQDYPLSLRLSAEEYLPGGYGIQDMEAIVNLFVQAGIDMIHASFGTPASPGGIVCPSIEHPAGFSADLAARIKQRAGVPVIAVGRFTRLEQAQAVLVREEADLIAFGRQHLADPDFFKNALKGRDDLTFECLACNQGCIRHLYLGKGIRCAINPVTGQEMIYPATSSARPRRVLVVGGGPAGLSVAWQAARLGHQVLLLEQELEWGGQIRIGARAPYKEAYGRWLERLAQSAVRAGATIKLGVKADKDFIRQQAPDVIIIATGAKGCRPAIPGIDSPQVVEAAQVMQGEVPVTDHTVIIGGGLVGMETADYLRAQKVNEVRVIEAGSRSPVKKFTGHGYLLHQRLQQAGYSLCLNARVVKILADSVVIEKEGRKELLSPVKQVIIATGSKSSNELTQALDREKTPYYLIGDARQPRGILEAVEEGARAAWNIE